MVIDWLWIVMTSCVWGNIKCAIKQGQTNTYVVEHAHTEECNSSHTATALHTLPATQTPHKRHTRQSMGTTWWSKYSNSDSAQPFMAIRWASLSWAGCPNGVAPRCHVRENSHTPLANAPKTLPRSEYADLRSFVHVKRRAPLQSNSKLIFYHHWWYQGIRHVRNYWLHASYIISKSRTVYVQQNLEILVGR